MASNAEPFDVRLAALDLGPVAEGGSPVARVGHLPNVVGALHALDPKGPWQLALVAKCIDEFADRFREALSCSRDRRANSRAKLARASKVGLINPTAEKTQR